MKRVLSVSLLLLIAVPVYAKSYICRTNGNIDTFENGEEVQAIRPLYQNNIEETALPAKNNSAVVANTVDESSAPEKKEPKKRSEFVPLTLKDIQERSSY